MSRMPSGLSLHFNSRPSARGDVDVRMEIAKLIISIHAPPRGATQPLHVELHIKAFQFTPLREGRRHLAWLRGPAPYFNSRPSARGDFSVRREVVVLLFQFTPLREGRQVLLYNHKRGRKFQFTPLREGRLCNMAYQGPRCQFQFTPLREGRHETLLQRGWFTEISIHAPPRGATYSRLALKRQ